MFGVELLDIRAGWNNPNPGVVAPAATRIIQLEFGEYIHRLAVQYLHLLLQHAPNPINLNLVNLIGRSAVQLENDINAATAPHLQQLAQNIEAERANIAPAIATAMPGTTADQIDQFITETIQQIQFLERQLGTVAIGQTVQQFIAILEPLFRNNFRILASTSVGRVLLYRLLIEINRRHNAGVTTGCCENGITIPGLIPPAPFTIRDCNRMIRIGLGNFEFVRGGGALAPIYAGININNMLPLLDVIGGNYGNDDIITQDNVTFDTALFHEMIHWYHCLRSPERMEQEFWNDNQNLETNFLWKHYWGSLHGTHKKLFAKYKWRSPLTDFDLEEVRTILGSYRLENSHYSTNERIYFEGDDLCENLYRACVGFPLRFGYNSPLSSENCKIIDKVIDTCSSNIILYLRKFENYRKVD